MRFFVGSLSCEAVTEKWNGSRIQWHFYPLTVRCAVKLELLQW